MKTNLNDTVTFTLTEAGAKLWNARYDDLTLDKYPDPLPAGAEVKTQLWLFMQVFGGRNIYMGMLDVPTVGNNLEIESSL